MSDYMLFAFSCVIVLSTTAPSPCKPPFTALVNNVIYFVYDVQGIRLLFDVILMIGFKKINRCTVNGHECACLGL